MARLRGDVEMVRVVVRLPKNTLNEVSEYVRLSGMYETYFLSAALVIGARSLMRTVQFPLQPDPPITLPQLQHESVSKGTVGAQEDTPITTLAPRKFPPQKGRPPHRTRLDDLRDGIIELDEGTTLPSFEP